MRDRNGVEIERGCYVRFSRDKPAKGTWRRFANKVGIVTGLADWEDELQARVMDAYPNLWFRRTEVLVVDKATFTKEMLGLPFCVWCMEKRVPTRDNKFCSNECYYASMGKVYAEPR